MWQEELENSSTLNYIQKLQTTTTQNPFNTIYLISYICMVLINKIELINDTASTLNSHFFDHLNKAIVFTHKQKVSELNTHTHTLNRTIPIRLRSWNPEPWTRWQNGYCTFDRRSELQRRLSGIRWCHRNRDFGSEKIVDGRTACLIRRSLPRSLMTRPWEGLARYTPFGWTWGSRLLCRSHWSPTPLHYSSHT